MKRHLGLECLDVRLLTGYEDLKESEQLLSAKRSAAHTSNQAAVHIAGRFGAVRARQRCRIQPFGSPALASSLPT